MSTTSVAQCPRALPDCKFEHGRWQLIETSFEKQMKATELMNKMTDSIRPQNVRVNEEEATLLGDQRLCYKWTG